MIGSGIAGLTATWLLKQHHDVTLYERQSRPGMGIFTVDYASNGETTTIDIPTRIFCEGYYPNLVAMLRMIGVRLQATNHSAAFADQSGEVFFHYGNRRLLGRSIDYPKGTSWLRGGGLQIARDSLRFFNAARRDCRENTALSRNTLREYLDARDYSEAFVQGVLLPTLSTMCTCDYDSVLAYPADMILECLTCGVMQQGVMRAESGVDGIVPRLLNGAESLCGVSVDAVLKEDEGAVVVSDGQRRCFDQVVVAAQAQQAAAMVAPQFADYSAALDKVRFEKSTMTVHTDTAVLPRSRVRLSPVTQFVPRQEPRPESTVNLTTAFATYRRQQPVFQTWNPIQPLRDECHLASADFTRPLVTLDSRAAIAALRESTYADNRNIWFCGAYMADKVPLLEAAVDSAVDISTRLGVAIPWRD